MFQIRQYRKSELALLYFPDCLTKRGALSNLMGWIKGNRDLHFLSGRQKENRSKRKSTKTS